MVLGDLFWSFIFLPVHHPSTHNPARPSIFVFTCPDDGWMGLYIKLCYHDYITPYTPTGVCPLVCVKYIATSFNRCVCLHICHVDAYALVHVFTHLKIYLLQTSVTTVRVVTEWCGRFLLFYYKMRNCDKNSTISISLYTVLALVLEF